MAEKSISVTAQDTGHPVFDATVNILMTLNGTTGIADETIKALHASLLAIYEKEPSSDPPF